MARIRSVKPDLWTDPDFIELSIGARLLFIAAKNFASDYGVLPDKAKQLKLQCFPGDDIDIEPLIDELVALGLWARRTAPDGARVLVIRAFNRHERVDKPNGGRWGNPATWSDDSRPVATPPESSRTVATTSESDATQDGSESSRMVATPPDDSCADGITGREGKGISLSSTDNSQSNVTSLSERENFKRTAGLVADALRAARKLPPDSERAWRKTVVDDVIATDGDLIRRMLADGDPPEQVALFVLGHGLGAASERASSSTAWCPPECPDCDGDGWIRTPEGLAPCPQRT